MISMHFTIIKRLATVDKLRNNIYERATWRSDFSCSTLRPINSSDSTKETFRAPAQRKENKSKLEL